MIGKVSFTEKLHQMELGNNIPLKNKGETCYCTFFAIQNPYARKEEKHLLQRPVEQDT
jgi:hypothetical protein